MSPWRGDINNPVPNNTQEPDYRSEKIINDNRAKQVRRDNDSQKNFTVSLYDIDETILLQLQQLQLQVEDVGKQITVPIFYGSPEKWVSAQRDGYIRDQQGKLILPAIIFKRTNSENDTSLQFFNRHLDVSTIKLYSQKNQYTKFSTLMGKNAPVNEIYNVIIPSHMLLTYHFIMWTEGVEQMNKLVETIQFNTKDYWGSTKGFKFRTRVDTYGHTVELQADQDRIVKTEFDLIVHGYILTDTITELERHKMTTQKRFTPKKIIMGIEVVGNEFNFDKLDKNKWRNPEFPNIPLKKEIPTPPPECTEQFLKVYSLYVNTTINQGWTLPSPLSSASPGQEGQKSYDNNYYYFYTGGEWKRVPIVLFGIPF